MPGIDSLRHVVKVEALRELEIQLDSGALVRPPESISYGNINLHTVRNMSK